MGTCPIRCQSNVTSHEYLPELGSPDAQERLIAPHWSHPSSEPAETTITTDFMTVRSTNTDSESYTPNNHAAQVTNRWLFTGISRHKAEELLMQPHNQSGAFLIRDSETDRNGHSLSVLSRSNSSYLSHVKHYRIIHLQNDWVYISPQLTFPSLHHLVEHYSESADGLCCRLTGPCFIQDLDHITGASPKPRTMRRPTMDWKNITRSVIFRRKRTDSDNPLVSEGLREAITSYLQMTEDSTHCWDT